MTAGHARAAGIARWIAMVLLLHFVVRMNANEELLSKLCRERCSQWLERRRPLVENAAAQVAWFGRNSEVAIESGVRPLTSQRS